MVAAYRPLTVALTALLLAACATEKTTASGAQCPDDSSSFGISVAGVGVTMGDSAFKAAFKAIRDYFDQRPAATGQADKAKAAELAADAAAKASARPMNDEQKRALRSQADQWVETYTEKCKPRS